jgi:hypothetical protein
MPAGFLLAEDAAVKSRFSAITVTDDRNTERPVSVFFRYPEGETEKKFPFITIEMIDLVHDTTRQLSETYYYYAKGDSASATVGRYLDYYPSTYNAQDMSDLDPGVHFFKMDSFVPVTLVYQISTFARSALHDRQLTSKILRRVMPFRRGFIEIPEDGTIRRFDLAGWATADLLDQEAGFKKRIFRKVFTVQMTAEIPTSDINLVKRVEEVVGVIKNKDQTFSNRIVAPNISEEF